MKNKIFILTAILITYLSLEGLCLLGLYGLKKSKKLTYESIQPIRTSKLLKKHAETIKHLIAGSRVYNIYDPLLGWSIQASSVWDKYQSNSQGLRANRDYQFSPPAGVMRISAFGDSFTHGDEVMHHETWEEYLNQINKNVEVLNFGVGGFGLDQAYLRYTLTGKKFKSDIVLIGMLSENVRRHVSLFRPFVKPDTGIPLTKPRFAFNEGTLDLIQNPMNSLEKYQYFLDHQKEVLHSIGKNDYYYNTRQHRGGWDFLPSVRLSKIIKDQIKNKYDRQAIFINKSYNPNSKAFALTTAIMSRFYKEITSDGPIPVIVLFPTKSDIHIFRKYNTKPYQPLLDWLDEQSMTVIDIMDLFEANELARTTHRNDLFIGGHYAPLMNQYVAQYIYHVLLQENMI